MKDDAPRPAKVPAKRRTLENENETLDRWIAEWLAGELTPSERRRLEAEKARRRALVPDHPVGILIGQEGATPEQVAALPDRLKGATSILMPRTQQNVYSAARSSCSMVKAIKHWDMDQANEQVIRELPREAGRIVALARTSQPEGTMVWDMVRLARHRGMPTTVIFPDGQLQGDANGD